MGSVFYGRLFLLMTTMKGHRIFLGIFAVFLLLRVPLIFTSQGHLDADEAVVALMAKHIVEKGEHPVFFSGLPYNGGASVEAHFAALLSYPCGLTRQTVKMSVLLLSLVLLVATYAFCFRFLGKTAADIASILLVSAEPLIIWNLKARGGYLEAMLFTILIPCVAFRIFFFGRGKIWHYSLFGLLCGLALWCQEMSLSLVGTMFLFWFVSDRTFFLRRSFVVFLVFFTLGNGPSLYYNLTNDYLNWRHALTFLPLEAFRHTQAALRTSDQSSIFTRAAAFFDVVPNGAEGWEGWPLGPGEISVFAWVSLAVIVLSVPASVYLSRGKQWHLRVSLLSLVYFVIHLLSVYVSSFRLGGGISRLYLPLYPLVPVSLAIFCDSLGGKRRRLAVPLVLLLLFSGHGAMKNIQFLGEKPIWTHPELAYVGGEIRPVPVATGGESILDTVDYLRSHGIHSVITSVYIKYRLIFESGEEISASSRFVSPTPDPFIYYDRRVQEDKTGPFAFVLFNVSAVNTTLVRSLKEKHIPWRQKTIREMTIYYPFTRNDIERLFLGTPAESFFSVTGEDGT